VSFSFLENIPPMLTPQGSSGSAPGYYFAFHRDLKKKTNKHKRIKEIEGRKMARKRSEDELDISFDEDNSAEFIYDEVNGSKGKKSVLSALNKKKVGKFEMDEIFCDFN
jgi:hypothetical protein